MMTNRNAYTIDNTLVEIIESVITKNIYELYISLPDDYDLSDDTYPVIFVLDGKYNFTLASSIAKILLADGDVPKARVIGVSWGGEDPDLIHYRNLEFTPTRCPSVHISGDGPKLLKVFKDEIIPQIENRFRTSGYRVLAGTSHGGLFSLYSLYKEPGLFDGIIGGTPSLWWDDHILYQYHNELKDNQRDDKVIRLFLTSGDSGFEDVKEFNKYLKLFSSKKIPQIEMESAVLKGTGHNSVTIESLSRGLQFIFRRPEVSLSEEVLQSYVGQYKFLPEGPGPHFVIKDGTLYDQSFGRELRLSAINENQFYLPGHDSILSFIKTDQEIKLIIESAVMGNMEFERID